MIKILGKWGLSLGAVTGAIFVGEPSLINHDESKAEIIKKETKRLALIEKFEDISLYAKQHGCTFAFENKWRNNKTYSAEQFIELERQKPTKFGGKIINDWEKRILEHAKKSTENCKDGKTLTFFYYDHEAKFVSEPKTVEYQTNMIKN